MMRFIILYGMLFLISCNTETDSEKVKHGERVVEIHKQADSSLPPPPPVETDYATYFIVVADTGRDYFLLRDEMIQLKNSLHISIDTLDRYYNKKKKLIVLPENAKDELYAGSYFPRRYPSENMSLEYLSYYQNEFDNKTIALVRGIYEDEKSADAHLDSLKKKAPASFKIKTKMYIGCVH